MENPPFFGPDNLRSIVSVFTKYMQDKHGLNLQNNIENVRKFMFEAMKQVQEDAATASLTLQKKNVLVMNKARDHFNSHNNLSRDKVLYGDRRVTINPIVTEYNTKNEINKEMLDKIVLERENDFKRPPPPNINNFLQEVKETPESSETFMAKLKDLETNRLSAEKAIKTTHTIIDSFDRGQNKNMYDYDLLVNIVGLREVFINYVILPNNKKNSYMNYITVNIPELSLIQDLYPSKTVDNKILYEPLYDISKKFGASLNVSRISIKIYSPLKQIIQSVHDHMPVKSLAMETEHIKVCMDRFFIHSDIDVGNRIVFRNTSVIKNTSNENLSVLNDFLNRHEGHEVVALGAPNVHGFYREFHIKPVGTIDYNIGRYVVNTAAMELLSNSKISSQSYVVNMSIQHSISCVMNLEV